MKRILLLLLLARAAAAQSSGAFDLSVKNIMRGPELVGSAPSNVQWTDDSRWVYFRWKPGGRPWNEEAALYRVPATGGAPQRVSRQAEDSVAALLAFGAESVDRLWRVVSYDGDLFVVDRRTLALRRLTDTRATETNPVFDRSGKTVYFVRDNNVYSVDLATGALRQHTDIRSGPAPQDAKPAEGQRGTLEQQQRELFEHIRRELDERAEAERRRKEREGRGIRAVFLDREERVNALAVDPAGRFALIHAGKPVTAARRTIIPDWVTRTGYTEPMEVRTKVGDVQSDAGRAGIVALATGEVRWLDVESSLAPDDIGGRKKGQVIGAIRFAGWNDAGSIGLIGSLSPDFKDQWLHSFDAATGKLTRLTHERNNAWIGGPCDFWSSCAGFLPSGQVYFASERDGYSHVYLIAPDGTGERQLTRGEWEVQRVTLSPNRDRFYLTTNEGSPHEVHFYHMDFDGKTRTRITQQPGRQDVTPSPDGQRIAVVHSTANRPPELYLGDNRAGAQLSAITDSPSAEWKKFAWITPEIVRFRARDGVMVPARIYRPKDVGAQPHGGAVIFVHGAGYLQNVHNWWSTYYREYMFHHLLAARGYVVLDIDYRGSAGYGRDWRTAVYRHMGGKDLTDQVDGVRYLAEREAVDAQRVGLYGGSYGGFITLMALFTQPESFAAGAALRAVTDWAHYNHGYTGRILNLPHTDSVAYRQSSPIYFAEGLQDPLLIAHGMVDTNVHFSDVVRLAQRLIELGKTNWEMAVYPVEDHGFVEPSSWTDEYRRILELFEKHLRGKR
jgi:dipeptidyl aminopeptidase/acylaminoacyl peptidase